ncbi:MAG: Trk system potassium transporter TrkA [Holosporales bacterium]|jgi:trk system potassium uptake protein TrkA|nr:Trk system potassium transporter TrkA [Holosporales bacterium]
MNIIVLGAGRVGYNVAKNLVARQNNVTVIDNNSARLNAVSNAIEVRQIFGHAADPNVLEQADAANADVLVAVTNVDEINLVACEVANLLFDIETKIARIRQQHYLLEKYKLALFHSKNLSVNYVISPEIEIAKSISKSIKTHGASYITDLLGSIQFISVKCNELANIINTPIRLLSNLFPSLSMAVVAIQRNGQTIIPKSTETIYPNDQVHIIVPESNVLEAMAAFGYTKQSCKNITIAGYSGVGKVLAAEIEKQLPDTKLQIIEKNPIYSELNSAVLVNTNFIKGDIFDSAILHEIDMHDCDSFIAVTEDDTTNVLAALLAKNNGAKQVMVLLNDLQNSKFITSIGVDSVVSKHVFTVSSVLRAIRQYKVKSLYSIDDGVELIEIYVSESSNIIGLQLDDITTPSQIFIAVLKRNDKIYICPENFVISVNDCLILVATKEMVYKIEKLVFGC